MNVIIVCLHTALLKAQREAKSLQAKTIKLHKTSMWCENDENVKDDDVKYT